MKIVQIRSFSGPYFPVLGLNTEIYGDWIQENTDQKNSVFGHFSCSAGHLSGHISGYIGVAANDCVYKSEVAIKKCSKIFKIQK